jgi:ABC-type glycerol-3-phosphate transport system substrate-binding protein
MARDQFTRRTYLKGTLASIAGAGFAGCLSGGGNNGTSNGNSQQGSQSMNWVRDVPQKSGGPVTYPNLGDMSGDPATKKAIKKFEEKTDIKINPRVINTDNLLAYSRTRLQAQSQVDAYTIYAAIMWPLANEGFFEEVSGPINDKYINAWAESVKDAYKLPHEYMNDFPYRKGYYATPFYDDMWVPFINKRVLKKAGFDPNRDIKTFSQFIDIATKLKKQGTVPFPVIFPYSSPGEGGNIIFDLIARSGGQVVDSGEPKFTSESTKRALDFFMALFERNLTPKGVTSLSEGRTTQQFFSGKSVFMFNASSNIFLPGKELPINTSASNVARITAYPKPKESGNTPSLNATPTGLALSVFSPNKKATAKFMNHMASPEMQKVQLITEGNVGLTPGIYDDKEVKQKVPYTNIFKQNLSNSTILKYPKSNEIRNMVYSVTQKAISQGWSSDKLAQQLQQETKSIL